MTDNKKHGVAVLFCVSYQLGLSAPNPDTKDFSGKVLWNLKSFRQNKLVYSVVSSWKIKVFIIYWYKLLIFSTCGGMINTKMIIKYPVKG
mgnify:CR=1 FL=1